MQNVSNQGIGVCYDIKKIRGDYSTSAINVKFGT